jgi:nitroreductase
MNGIASCVDQVLRSRRSTRAFTQQPVPAAMVREILQVAACAPSNSNTQPWRVHVVTGDAMQALGTALVAAFQAGTAPASTHFPDPLPDVFAERQGEFGARYYAALGIDRADAQARARQTQRNFTFFGAPVGLLFTIDRRLTAHSWLDLGLFVQSVMIAAKARGIDTCPQVSFARFHDVIADQLQLPPHEVTACGMSMGHGAADARVNRMEMQRLSVDQFARFVGFGESQRIA